MKSALLKIGLAIGCAATFATVSMDAQAYYYYHNHGYYGHRHYYGRPYYRHYNNYYNCRWVSGHWRYGVWYPARRVCW